MPASRAGGTGQRIVEVLQADEEIGWQRAGFGTASSSAKAISGCSLPLELPRFCDLLVEDAEVLVKLDKAANGSDGARD